jgi:hypothetical protein
VHGSLGKSPAALLLQIQSFFSCKHPKAIEGRPIQGEAGTYSGVTGALSFAFITREKFLLRVIAGVRYTPGGTHPGQKAGVAIGVAIGGNGFVIAKNADVVIIFQTGLNGRFQPEYFLADTGLANA